MNGQKWVIFEQNRPLACTFFFQRRSCDNTVELFHSNVILFLCICTHNLREDKGWTSPRTVIGKTKHTSQRGLLSLTWQPNQHLPVIYFKPWKELALLYKHQWNTRWAFARKHIFTREFHMWKYHRCYGYIINRAFRRKKLFQWNGLVFHWCLYNK